MIAICLLTCDRFEYTERTLASLAAHNDLSQFALFHADDASTDPRVPLLAQSYGFRTVVAHTERQGWLVTRMALIKHAIRRRSSWILNLENDIESVRPFPWELFRFASARADVSCLRLYGTYKDRARRDACLTLHKHTRADPRWRPFRFAPEKSQIGRIHWSAQPSVTRARAIWDHHRFKADLPGLTVRVKKNVMVHIGVRRTPAIEAATC